MAHRSILYWNNSHVQILLTGAERTREMIKKEEREKNEMNKKEISRLIVFVIKFK